MKKLIAALMMAALSSAALATKIDHPVKTPPAPTTQPSTQTQNVNVSSPSSSTASAAAAAEAHAGAQSSSNAQGGSSSSTLEQKIITKVKGSAPPVYATGTNNNVPCHGEWHVGASAVGAGVGFGRDRKDIDCLLKAAADDQYERGNYAGAAQLYCGIKYYQQAFGDRAKCVLALDVTPPESEHISLSCDDCATRDELQKVREDLGEKINRVFRSTTGK